LAHQAIALHSLDYSQTGTIVKTLYCSGFTFLALCTVADLATVQTGEKAKLLLCRAFNDCASFERVQDRKHKVSVSHADQWAP
jgi:hypothetical protein